MLTQQLLKETVNYDPETGIFTVLKTRSGSGKIGEEAGYLPKDGYRRMKLYGKCYKSHRIAFLWMTGNFPVFTVDHINGIKDDNRWENLRDVTHRENVHNSKKLSTNTSGVSGVSFYKRTNSWKSYITYDKKRHNLGTFSSFEDAVLARKQAEKEFGFHPNHGR